MTCRAAVSSLQSKMIHVMWRLETELGTILTRILLVEDDRVNVECRLCTELQSLDKTQRERVMEAVGTVHCAFHCSAAVSAPNWPGLQKRFISKNETSRRREERGGAP